MFGAPENLAPHDKQKPIDISPSEGDKMNRKLILTAAVIGFCLQLCALAVRAQADDPPKVEVAAEFTLPKACSG